MKQIGIAQVETEVCLVEFDMQKQFNYSSEYL